MLFADNLTVSSVSVNNARLTYYELNPSLPVTIFFLHGNSGSSRTWRKQFSYTPFASYRLIGFDLPAHGNSEAAADLDYSLSGLGKVVAEAIDVLAGNAPFILVGFSLGANLAVEISQWVAPTGIVLTSPGLLGEGIGPAQVVQPGVDLSPIFADNVPKSEVIRFARLAAFSDDKADLEEFINDHEAVKPPFRSKYFESILQENYSNEIGLLKNSKNALVIFGAEDRVIKPGCLDSFENFTYLRHVHKLPRAGHFVHTDQPIIFNKLIADYLTEVIPL